MPQSRIDGIAFWFGGSLWSFFFLFQNTLIKAIRGRIAIKAMHGGTFIQAWDVGSIVSLAEYWAKRDFARTPEPRGEVRDGCGSLFVVQEHHASTLHWDLRLGRDGVLKSWAVPKGPPEEKGVRRLAVQTEDHPFQYAYFEGSIPEGEYGGGTISIWDRGEYETEKWWQGEIIVRLIGKRLRGRYCMIRLRGQPRNWLLFRCGEDG